jgi:hypothetical protein
MCILGSLFQETKKVYIGEIQNNVISGPLVNNSQLSLGVKSILEESLQDKGYDIVEKELDADYVVEVSIDYFDYRQSKVNFAFVHKDENTLLISMRGQLYQNGNTIKDVNVTEQSTELISSTGLLSTDGTFSSTMVRNTVKKSCISVITKLF